MIITFTPNPSVDRAFDVAALELGEINRASAVHTDAGGKGINVSRGLTTHSIDTTAVFPFGGADGELLANMLKVGGISTVPVEVPGETRTNITVVDERGATTKINAPGPQLSDDILGNLLDAIRATANPGDTIVGAGSLPAGAPHDTYVRVAEVAREVGAHLVLDTSGEPLRHAVNAGGLALIKPNEDELGELVGRELTTVGEVVEAARQVISQGTTTVLVSLGGHGALLVTEATTWWAGGPVLVPASTVGAGDMTLAGYISATGKQPHERLRTAVAWGRAAVLLPGTAVPTPRDIDEEAVRLVENPDPTHTIKEL